jgi:hypothetical protein
LLKEAEKAKKKMEAKKAKKQKEKEEAKKVKKDLEEIKRTVKEMADQTKKAAEPAKKAAKAPTERPISPMSSVSDLIDLADEDTSPPPPRGSRRPEKAQPTQDQSDPESAAGEASTAAPPKARGYADTAKEGNTSRDTIDVTKLPKHHSYDEMMEALKSTAIHPRRAPAGFGAEAEGDGPYIVFGHCYGGSKACQLNLCRWALTSRKRVCPEGINCKRVHKWPNAQQMRYLATQPSEEGKAAFRDFCEKFYDIWLANWHKSYKNHDREEPLPTKPVGVPLYKLGKERSTRPQTAQQSTARPQPGQQNTARPQSGQQNTASSSKITPGDFNNIPPPPPTALPTETSQSDQQGAAASGPKTTTSRPRHSTLDELRKRNPKVQAPAKDTKSTLSGWKDQASMLDQDQIEAAKKAQQIAEREAAIAQGAPRYTGSKTSYKAKPGDPAEIFETGPIFDRVKRTAAQAAAYSKEMADVFAALNLGQSDTVAGDQTTSESDTVAGDKTTTVESDEEPEDFS